MKPMISCTLLAFVLAGSSLGLHAQTNAAPVIAAAPAENSRGAIVEKHAKPILAALNLNDAAKEAKVRAAIGDGIIALDTWHEQNDDSIKGFWNDFNHARSQKDQAAADAALAKIDGVYATFKPQHDKFLADLATVLTPAQVETVKDVLTVKKVEVTYQNYLLIFPTLTEAQKAVVLNYLKDAREEAINAKSMTEKSAFFKKYKIKIEEGYLTQQGYDPKQARKDFAAKQKADAPGSTPATRAKAE